MYPVSANCFLKVYITLKRFGGRIKLYIALSKIPEKNFHLVEPSIICKFSKLFFPARPSEAKTRDIDIIPFQRSHLGHLHQLVVV